MHTTKTVDRRAFQNDLCLVDVFTTNRTRETLRLGLFSSESIHLKSHTTAAVHI